MGGVGLFPFFSKLFLFLGVGGMCGICSFIMINKTSIYDVVFKLYNIKKTLMKDHGFKLSGKFYITMLSCLIISA